MIVKPADLSALTKNIGLALRAAVLSYMSETKKLKVTADTKSVSLNHTELQPEGHTFTIQIVVEIHENTKGPE